MPSAVKPTRAKRRYTLYTAILATAIMLGLYLFMGVWPFGDGTVLTGDLGGIYINFYAHFKRALAGQAGFAYGFDKGLGGNLIGLFAYYCASPYNLLYSLVPVRWFPVMASFVLLAKIVLSCVAFRLYFSYKVPRLGWRSVALSLCYGFMSYTIAYAQNPMWHDCVVLLPLICLGIDRIVKGKPLTVYAACLGLCILSDFYIAFMVCIFAVLYFCWAMLVETTRPPGWRAPLLRFGGGSLLAGGLCAALLLPALANINQNKGSLFSLDFSFARKFPLLRLPERLVWAGFSSTDLNDSLPLLYCGVVVILLVVCYFASKVIPRREKLLSGGMLVIFALSFWISGLDTIWHGLKVPVWFPARYSFCCCFFLVVLAGRAMAVRAAGKRELLTAGGGLIVALLVLAIYPISVSRSRLLVNIVLLCGYVFLLVFYAMTTSFIRRRFLTGLLALMVAAELFTNALFINRQLDQYALSGFQNFVDDAGGTVTAIQKHDTGTGYRIAENWFRSLNDPLLLGYKGMSHFASTQDGPAQGVLYNLGFRNYEGGGPYLSGGTAFADSVLGFAYHADSGNRAVPSHWEQIFLPDAPYRVYQNPTVMPMLFGIPTPAPDTRTGQYEPDLFAYQNDFARLLGAQKDIFTPVNQVQLTDAQGQLILDYTRPTVESRYQITAAQPGYHYAYFTAKGYRLLPLLVNGNATAPYLAPDFAGVVDLGWLDKGETATLQFLQHEDLELTGVYFSRLDGDALNQLSDAAQANTGDFEVRDGHITGQLTAQEDRLTLYTSVAYDENWQATVNGQAVQPFQVMGGLLALPLQEGDNAVELHYAVQGAQTGAVVSGVFVFLFAGAAALEAVLQKRRKKTLEAAQEANTSQ